MSMYNSGDIVTIVDEDVIRSFEGDTVEGWTSPEGLYIDPSMLEYCGRSFRIGASYLENYDGEDFDELRTDEWYILTENTWIWSSSCFKNVEDAFEGMEDLL